MPWETTDNEIRYRVRDPEHFIAETYRRKKMKGADGVSMNLAKLKQEYVPDGHAADSMVLQSLRFPKKTSANPNGWTIDEAKQWVKDHPSTTHASYAWEGDDIVNGDDVEIVRVDISTNTPVTLHASCVTDDIELSADADLHNDKNEHTFAFILCHAGMNRNGDYFDDTELQAKAQTIVGKRVDFKHSKAMADVVGQVISAQYIGNGIGGGQINCIGRLLSESPFSELAYRLMKLEMVKQVSMECDYEYGECSICKMRYTNIKNQCTHLTKYKGTTYTGKPVYAALHNVTFTGVGLLDRPGGDPDARITQVASANDEGGGAMDETEHVEAEAEFVAVDDVVETQADVVEAVDETTGDGVATEAQADETIADAVEGDAIDALEATAHRGKPADEMTPEDHMKRLVDKNKELETAVTAMQQELEGMRMREQASMRRKRAEDFVQTMAGDGFPWGDEAPDAVDHLSGCDDAQYVAAEAAYKRAQRIMKKQPAVPDFLKKTASTEKQTISTVAQQRPVNVPDVDVTKTDLTKEFQSMFQTARNERSAARAAK